MVRKHTRVDGFGINKHIADQDKFLSRFNQFKPQEKASKVKHGLAGTSILRSNDGAARPLRFDA
jgi:hypothetical protein